MNQPRAQRTKDRRIARQQAEIKSLRKQLHVARMLARALSKLAFAPKDAQNPYRLGMVKRAHTLHQQLTRKKAA